MLSQVPSDKPSVSHEDGVFLFVIYTQKNLLFMAYCTK